MTVEAAAIESVMGCFAGSHLAFGPAGLLSALAGLDVHLVAGVDGPELDIAPGALTDDIIEACRAHRWLFAWALQAAGQDYAWHICDRCDQVKLVSVKRSTLQRCSLTWGCKGLMRPGPQL